MIDNFLPGFRNMDSDNSSVLFGTDAGDPFLSTKASVTAVMWLAETSRMGANSVTF